MKTSELANYNAMLNELKSGNSIFCPSAFWEDLNSKNLHMLEVEGLSNFKRTVSQNYFNWFIASVRHPLFRHVFSFWCRHPNLLPLRTRLGETDFLRLTTSDQRQELSLLQRNAYRLYVCFVWTIMSKFDHHGLRLKVSEPEIGNPFPLRVGKKLLSQDLASSVLECNVLADITQGVTAPRIAEVGAGYGRLAHTYVTSLPGRYFIFDIPPALTLSQWYLEQTIGPKDVFRFRHFDKFEDIETELGKARVAFFTANQIQKFPKGYFDVALSISTLPEMRQDQAECYLAEFQRLSRSHIFLKQWISWKNPCDGTELTTDSYRFEPQWHLTLDRIDPVIPNFFNRVWSRKT
jgi:putative sugar O-methyltransferase